MITATIGKDRFKTELTTGNHSATADEASGNGGTDLGPAPAEFLMMSLASCTAITLRMYADRKQWAADKIRVDVEMEKSGEGTLLRRHVSLEGALDETQRERLLQIANSCPIHKMLTHPIEIKTDLI